MKVPTGLEFKLKDMTDVRLLI
jgi:hypothetical protein